MIEQGNTMTSGQTSVVHDLLITKEELQKERDMLSTMISSVKSETNAILDKIKIVKDFDIIKA